VPHFGVPMRNKRVTLGLFILSAVICLALAGAACTSTGGAGKIRIGGSSNTLTYRLQVHIIGKGTVTLEPPGRDFPVGTVVTLSAAPAPGYRFNYFSFHNKKVSTPSFSLKMMTDIIVVANFGKK